MANWSTQTATRECQIASNGELTVVERLATLLQTGQFADVTIRVGEGKDITTFKAHRLLLATASQPLSNLVTSHIKNGPSGEIVTLHVTDIDPFTFQHVLKYLYTDDLDISGVGESLALLKMGKKWDLPKLVVKTVKYIDVFLNEYEPTSEERKNELCDLIVLTEEIGLTELNTKCWTILVKDVNSVVPCQGFLNMSKDMVRRLLTHSDFKFKNQLVLFEAIRDWGMNQVLQRNLSVNSLQGLIGDFLQFVDFKAIEDADFLDTILPSDVLGKGELIAFFMTRGLEIPRDLAYNNNLKDAKNPYENAGRYKRGFKLPNQEIYKEHELRFRVDKKLRLLGVGFGFLFSNTDMGITVHCQGPWETRQWRDIIQTYCRVTWEKMKTADVRLMFSEPVTIEPNHSYKVLVRVSRMSAGSHDVDLWGGAQGVSRIKMQEAEFSFLKAAIDPKKEVEEEDTENKPGMITDLFYELEDGTSIMRTLRGPMSCEYANHDAPPSPKKNNEETFTSHNNYHNEIINSYETQKSEPSFTYNNEPLSTVDTDDYSPTQSTPKPKKSYVDEAASYYLTTKPSAIRGSDTIPSFLKPSQPSVDRSKPAWQIPYRPRATIPSAFSGRKSRETSVHREGSASKETNYISRRPSRKTSIYDNTPLAKYNYGVSSIKSKFDANPSTNLSTRTNYESSTTPTSPYSKWSSGTSRYGTSSTTGVSESRYGTSSTSTATGSRYGSSSTSTLPESRYGTSSSSTTSGSRYGSSSTSTVPESRYGSSNTNTVAESRYGSSSTGTVPESRYGSSSTSTVPESRYGAASKPIRQYTSTNSDTKYGSADNTSYSRFGTGSAFSRVGRENAPSPPSRTSTVSPSFVRNPQTTAQTTTDTAEQNRTSDAASPISRYSSYSSPRVSSRYGTSTTSSIGTSKYSSDIGRSSRSSLSRTERKDSDATSSSNTPSSTGTSRYGTSSSSTGGTTGTTESRYSSLSATTPSYSSSNRYGTKSSTGFSSRFGSSIYRR